MSNRVSCDMASHCITGATATKTCLAICSHVTSNCAGFGRNDDTRNDDALCNFSLNLNLWCTRLHCCSALHHTSNIALRMFMLLTCLGISSISDNVTLALATETFLCLAAPGILYLSSLPVPSSFLPFPSPMIITSTAKRTQSAVRPSFYLLSRNI